MFVDLGDATNRETTHVGLEFVGNGYSRLGLSYRLTRVGLEKAARNWIGSSWTREGSKIMDRLGWDSSVSGGLKAGVSGDAHLPWIRWT